MLERFAPDIICLQETWLVGEFAAPWVAGFTWYEHRRTKGKRGGIAILVRKGINILSNRSSEFAQVLSILSPHGARGALCNVYMPPTTSLARRRVSEDSIRS